MTPPLTPGILPPPPKKKKYILDFFDFEKAKMGGPKNFVLVHRPPKIENFRQFFSKPCSPHSNPGVVVRGIRQKYAGNMIIFWGGNPPGQRRGHMSPPEVKRHVFRQYSPSSTRIRGRKNFLNFFFVDPRVHQNLPHFAPWDPQGLPWTWVG